MKIAYEKGRELVNPKIKKVSETDLRKALKEVNRKNREIRESFRITKDVMDFICY